MHEIHEEAAVESWLQSGKPLHNVVFQNLDLRPYAAELVTRDLEGAIFLGCELERGCLAKVVESGGLSFPRLGRVPWETYRTELYTAGELFDGFDYEDACSYCDTYDARVWRHWRDRGAAHPTSLIETLARRLHDHAIYEAMNDVLASQERVVAVMGGHSMKRDDPGYAKVARMSRKLSELGFFLASGGGPGAMEATHLGAWFAGRDDKELEDAIQILSEAPLYKDREFLGQAFRVREKYPYESSCPKSLGVPTWLYGHEPPNPFATYIAKFFANSVREDGLVSIASHGIVFAPGSAGTIQEIFQDAAQNHYATVKSHAAPMVFMGEQYWREERPVFGLLATMSKGRPYADLITIGDDIDTLVKFLVDHPPIHVDGAGWSVCGLHCGQ